jgi:hypothetical protein
MTPPDNQGPRANLKKPWLTPSYDGDMLTIAYLSGAQDAKATIKNLSGQVAALKALLADAVNALKPLAMATDYTSYLDCASVQDRVTAEQITFGDIRRARAIAEQINKEINDENNG